MEPTKEFTLEFRIEREPRGSGGRRFACCGGPEGVVDTLYLGQEASRALGSPDALEVVIRPKAVS